MASDNATANKDRRTAEETCCARRPAGRLRLTGGSLRAAEPAHGSGRGRSGFRHPWAQVTRLPGPGYVEGVVTLAFNGQVL